MKKEFDLLLKKLEKEIQYRDLITTEKNGVIDEENRIVEFSLSSEEPYERWFGIEILGHEAENVNMARFLNRAPLLLDHNPKDVIGVIEKFRIENKRLIVQARFSKNPKATEVWNDIKDKIRSKVSVGYFINDMVQLPKANEFDENETLKYLVKKWTPFEGSVVGIPADDTVGVGKNLENLDQPVQEIEVKTVDLHSADQIHEIKIIREGKKMTEELINMKKEIQEITKMGEEWKKSDLALEFIREGKTSKEFSERILADFKK